MAGALKRIFTKAWQETFLPKTINEDKRLVVDETKQDPRNYFLGWPFPVGKNKGKFAHLSESDDLNEIVDSNKSSKLDIGLYFAGGFIIKLLLSLVKLGTEFLFSLAANSLAELTRSKLLNTPYVTNITTRVHNFFAAKDVKQRNVLENTQKKWWKNALAGFLTLGWLVFEGLRLLVRTVTDPEQSYYKARAINPWLGRLSALVSILAIGAAVAFVPHLLVMGLSALAKTSAFSFLKPVVAFLSKIGNNSVVAKITSPITKFLGAIGITSAASAVGTTLLAMCVAVHSRLIKPVVNVLSAIGSWVKERVESFKNIGSSNSSMENDSSPRIIDSLDDSEDKDEFKENIVNDSENVYVAKATQNKSIFHLQVEARVKKCNYAIIESQENKIHIYKRQDNNWVRIDDTAGILPENMKKRFQKIAEAAGNNVYDVSELNKSSQLPEWQENPSITASPICIKVPTKMMEKIATAKVVATQIKDGEDAVEVLNKTKLDQQGVDRALVQVGSTTNVYQLLKYTKNGEWVRTDVKHNIEAAQIGMVAQHVATKVNENTENTFAFGTDNKLTFSTDSTLLNVPQRLFRTVKAQPEMKVEEYQANKDETYAPIKMVMGGGEDTN